MLDIALKDLKGHKLRTALTMLGIIIAITAIISLGSISAGVNELMASSVNVIGSDKIFVMKKFDLSDISGPAGSLQIEEIDKEAIETIRSMPGVKRAVPIISRNFGGFFEIDGIDMNEIDIFGAQDLGFEEGTWPENDEEGIAIGYLIARRFDVGVGDYIVINKKEVEVVGVFEEGSGAYDLAGLMPFDYAEEIYGTDGGATQIIIEPDDISMVEKIKQQIEEEFDDLQAITMKEALSMFQEMTATMNIMTFGIGFIASLVAAIGIVITMYTSVLERRRQLGIMKAVGALRRVILVQIIEESIIISLVGSTIALIISFFMVDMLNKILLGGSNIALITPGLAGGAIIYGVGLSILSSLYPAWIAVKINPIDAIREG